MNYGIESSSGWIMDQEPEVLENISESDSLPETDRISEDFDDCRLSKPTEEAKPEEVGERDEFADCFLEKECEAGGRKEAGDGKSPEDFEKKNTEIREIQEVFETKELQEIKDQVSPAYENGVKIAEKVEKFNTYKEHHKLEGGHIEKVHDKSLQAAAVLESSFKENSYEGLYSDTIDHKTLEMMALYHDTGMDGNIDFEKFEKEAYEDQLRKEHSIQSAIHALRDREFIEAHDVDADKVALGCLVHSKSYSDVNNLASETQWKKAAEKLQNAVVKFNDAHPDEQISFSDSFLKCADGSYDKAALAEMRSESLCLRIGDANGHDSASRTSQNGKEIEFSLDGWKENQDNLPESLEKKILAGDCRQFKTEVQDAHVFIDGAELDNENDPKGFSRMFAVGEGNFKNVDLELAGGRPTQKFELENGDAYPLSTQYCILERLKEYNTAKIAPPMEIERPEGMPDADFKKYKEAQADSMQKIDFVAEIHIGAADDRTIASYQAFADRVNDQYDIDVKIVHDKDREREKYREIRR